MSDSSLAFYREEAGGYVPTGLGISPWNPDAQLGVCLGGLVAHAIESIPSPAPMLTARLTIDILGAVPIERLMPTTRVLREGRRLQLVEAELRANGRCWVRGTALRVRTADSPAASVPPTHPFPAEITAARAGQWAQTVRIGGDHTIAGPGALWLRIVAALIEGRTLTPLQAVAMAADFGSGTAPPVPMASWSFANVDISIHLARAPVGDWLLVDALSESAGNGVGLTHSRLGDSSGMIGMAHQTTFLDRR